MIIEEKRILKMAYLLLEADGFLKAGDFARELNLSERTVKNDGAFAGFSKRLWMQPGFGSRQRISVEN